MTEDEIREIADDNDSGRTTSGRRLFSDRNLLLFARAIEKASRRAALEEAAEMCMRATPDARMRRALGDAAHYVACANAIRALSGPTET